MMVMHAYRLFMPRTVRGKISVNTPRDSLRNLILLDHLGFHFHHVGMSRLCVCRKPSQRS